MLVARFMPQILRNRSKAAAFAMSVAAVASFALPASTAQAAPTAVDCDSGDVCFWTERNFEGRKCSWNAADMDWRSAPVTCSWSATHNVKSVYNAGTSSRFTGVVYYKGANGNDRAGCTRQQHGGNLAGTYKLRSHEWTTGRCG
ncbi:peptidase inhibitor family I36 protein [Streptomyces sp. NBC_00286]|uniref:peptidase inhibitor family I36 protein n=1 Tax=Streptomyces sp. NBC_00286 TaxID=2975701 RepID=UPI002E2C8082|nr:peptidase inhibitor family I36 protein [Streptomyces sp. NBC_00286]